ncbi:MAG: hypothetical protein IKU38_00735 [Clostridia bacterium]|nr:hypothetical protein [Clostridia bacterium]
MKDYLFCSLRSFVCALCTAALGALTIALMLALYDIPRTVDLAFVYWGGTLLALALACEALSRRELSLLVYLSACCAILYAGGERIITHTVFIPGSNGFPLLLRMCIWLSGAACAWSCRRQPDSNVFVRMSDALILAIGFYMATLYALGEAMIMPVLGFALAALLLSMLITAALRAGGESDSVIRGTGIGGYLVIGGLLAVCLLLAALLLSLSGGHVSSLVEAFLVIWGYLSRAAISVMTAIGLFLAYLFGGQRMMQRQQAVYQDSPAYQTGVMTAAQTAPAWVVYLIMGAIAAVLLTAVIAILWVLRSTRLSSTRKAKSRRRVTRTSRMGEAIRALIARIAGAITFELRYRANRHTPQGLYIFAVRACRIKLLPKHKNESAGAYIRRLHQILLKQTGLSTLDRLADMLDRALYSDSKPHLSRGEADAFAAQIRAIAAPALVKPTKSE